MDARIRDVQCVPQQLGVSASLEDIDGATSGVRLDFSEWLFCIV